MPLNKLLRTQLQENRIVNGYEGLQDDMLEKKDRILEKWDGEHAKKRVND